MKLFVNNLASEINFNGNRYDHTAQFSSNNMIRKYYWFDLLDSFGLIPDGEAKQILLDRYQIVFNNERETTP